ncbi:hypothetical protein QE443_004688 [Pantoea ananatis]|nr:hypothetical protein [Pantoea ananatis]MDQ1228427.1 hypothetical protein [Pantoea ananatis]
MKTIPVKNLKEENTKDTEWICKVCHERYCGNCSHANGKKMAY